MTLDEALELCTETKPIGNRFGDKEAIITFLPEKNCYRLQEGRPWIVEPSRLIGECLSKEEVKVRIADVSFASKIDPKGWVVNPEKE